MNERNPKTFCTSQHIDDLIEELRLFSTDPNYKNKSSVSLNHRQVEMILSKLDSLNLSHSNSIEQRGIK